MHAVLSKCACVLTHFSKFVNLAKFKSENIKYDLNKL